MQAVLVLTIAYLLGSIPFGYLIVRATKGADVRQTGSGGTGATNVSRRAGKAAGVLTLVLDAAKGAAAIWLARWLSGNGPAINGVIAFAGIAAIVGHCFPVWLGFRGGKGVATALGVFLSLAPIAVAFAAIIFLVVVGVTRYVSLGSITATLAIPFFIWVQNNFVNPVIGLAPVISAAIIGGLLIILMHRANIGRLIKGKESKFR